MDFLLHLFAEPRLQISKKCKDSSLSFAITFVICGMSLMTS